MSLGFAVIDRDGEIIESEFAQKSFIKDHSFAKHIKNLRVAKKVINMDEGIMLNLKNVPENAKSVVLLARFNHAGKYNEEQ